MPRTYVAAERSRLAGDYNVYSRVEVRDSDGTWRDLTAYAGGRNFFVSAKWTRQLDAPVMSGTVTFLRLVLGASLAPTVVNSIMNTNAANAYSPLLAGGRGIRISTATTAVGVAPLAGDWKEMFLGRIDDPDWGGDDGTITCTISDVGAWLLGKNIDTQRQYGLAAGQPLETVIQNILNDNVSGPLGAVTLYTPISPGWNIKLFFQQKQNVLTAIRTLAQQIGWDVRYQYDATNVYRLTLFQPARTKSVADYALGSAAEYYALPQLVQNLGDVRTRIGGSYVDSAAGARLWRYVQADAAHTNQYDVVYMEINEDASSNIDTSVEMDKMLNAALSDLQDPWATQGADLPYFWLAELGDLVAWPANAVHYDGTQNLAVVGIAHTLDASGEVTTLTCRGKVAGNVKEWLQKQDHAPAFVGPTLDVVAQGGATAYTLTFSTSARNAIELSVNGGAYSPAPASPLTVTRPAVGAAPLEYAFRTTLNGQTVTDAVTIQPIDKDTVTPDISVVPSLPTDTTQSFTVTTSNPSGGVLPAVSVTPRGTTAVINSSGATIADGTTASVGSGEVIRVNRPAFATGPQSSVEFAATLSGAGTQRVQRSILNQVKTSFGPTLVVTTTVGAAGAPYTIYWSGSPGIQLSIDGAALATPPASPISVPRPAAGAPDKKYIFQTAVVDGVQITDTASVPSLDKDTVTPTIAIVQSAPSATQIVYQVNGADPTGAVTPTVSGTVVGTTLNGGTTPAGTYTGANGSTFTVDRPPFGTVTQAQITLEVVLGNTRATVVRSIANQVKTSFGPSLVVTPTPSSASYSLAYSGAYDTLVLSIDGAAYAAPAASPITVTRGTASHTYSFKATRDGVDVVQTVTVPALDSSSAPSFSALTVGPTNYTSGTIPISWTGANAPAGATYNVTTQEQDVGTNVITQTFIGVTSPYAYTPATTPSSTGTVSRYVKAFVVMIDSAGANTLATSATKQTTFLSTKAL